MMMMPLTQRLLVASTLLLGGTATPRLLWATAQLYDDARVSRERDES